MLDRESMRMAFDANAVFNFIFFFNLFLVGMDWEIVTKFRGNQWHANIEMEKG